jgi:hypothetical protein
VPASANSSRDNAALSADASTSQNRRPVGTSGLSDTQASSRQPESTQARGATELPRTASPVPLVGLIGLLSLAGALSTRRFASARQ